jgi:hypothetical protein
MADYHVNTNPQSGGEHEVHETGCGHQPNPGNRHNLGDHPNCQSAVRAARTTYPTADGCYYCSNACHRK